MARPVDRCPVCGGEMVEKEVDKVLRGGNLTETLKIQAAVCLHCGERIYKPEDVDRFEEIRSTLAANDTANSRNTVLRAKLGYEVWLLDFLKRHDDRVQGQGGPPVVELTSGSNASRIRTFHEEHLSSFYGAPVMTAIMPLTFVASFKVLDTIFEWFLEENRISGKIKKVPWQFKEKVKLLKRESDFQLPRLFEKQPYLYSYAKALYCRLLTYRNEVVHNNSFSVSNGTLTLSSSREGTSLALSSEQVACMVRFVRLLVRALLGEIILDDHKIKMSCQYLDALAPAHGLETFDQPLPYFVRARLTVPRQGAGFPADLKLVRDKVAGAFPAEEVVFDLRVRAVDGETLVAAWYFAEEEVPDSDAMTFYEESHRAHREALVE